MLSQVCRQVLAKVIHKVRFWLLKRCSESGSHLFQPTISRRKWLRRSRCLSRSNSRLFLSLILWSDFIDFRGCFLCINLAYILICGIRCLTWRPFRLLGYWRRAHWLRLLRSDTFLLLGSFAVFAQIFKV